MKYIQLTKGARTKVSNADHERLSRVHWGYDGRYACRSIRVGRKNKKVYLHQFVLRRRGSLQIDHINRDTLDNRRENLRLVGKARNQHNSKIHSHNKSGFKGVWFSKRTGKWLVQIVVKKKKVHVGVFQCPIKGARAYDMAAKRFFGKWCCTNKEMGLL